MLTPLPFWIYRPKLVNRPWTGEPGECEHGCRQHLPPKTFHPQSNIRDAFSIRMSVGQLQIHSEMAAFPTKDIWRQSYFWKQQFGFIHLIVCKISSHLILTTMLTHILEKNKLELRKFTKVITTAKRQIEDHSFRCSILFDLHDTTLCKVVNTSNRCQQMPPTHLVGQGHQQVIPKSFSCF